MGKVWVLDTETKGTGAEMVPLEKVLEQPSPRPERVFIPPKRRKPAEPAPKLEQPRKFKIVDVMTHEALAEDVGARAAVDALEDVRSVVDVWVYVWDEDGQRWRSLTLAEQNVLWDLRGR